MFDYEITYVLDGRIRKELWAADTMAEAVQLFRRQHPFIKIVGLKKLENS